jgi:hypothetical protein
MVIMDRTRLWVDEVVGDDTVDILIRGFINEDTVTVMKEEGMISSKNLATDGRDRM